MRPGTTVLGGGATLTGSLSGVADFTANIRASAHVTAHIERLVNLGLVLSAVITPLAKVPDGQRIELVTPVYETLFTELQRDPSLRYEIPWRNFEEVAASYRRRGFDVVLTPPSGDFGRDVIATLTIPGHVGDIARRASRASRGASMTPPGERTETLPEVRGSALRRA